MVLKKNLPPIDAFLAYLPIKFFICIREHLSLNTILSGPMMMSETFNIFEKCYVRAKGSAITGDNLAH